MKTIAQKTYRAIRHEIVRAKQKQNADEVHHPNEKINQIKSYNKEIKQLKNI